MPVSYQSRRTIFGSIDIARLFRKDGGWFNKERGAMLTPERKGLIDTIIRELRASLRIVPPVDDDELLNFYRARDYTSMVRFVRDSMRLTLRIRVGRVLAGGVSAPAWVVFNDPLPLFGSKALEEDLATIYLRRDFLDMSEFEPTVVAISHEMSHLVLEAIRHPMRKIEEAVDITAMMLGYRDFFVTGTVYKPRPKEVPRSPLEAFLLGAQDREKWRIGYLNPAEMRYAAHSIVV